jgi:hypothetical protein
VDLDLSRLIEHDEGCEHRARQGLLPLETCPRTGSRATPHPPAADARFLCSPVS